MKEYIISLPEDEGLDAIAKVYTLHELVQCKNCKHVEISPSGLMKCNNIFRSPDWYCADGEAKE